MRCLSHGRDDGMVNTAGVKMTQTIKTFFALIAFGTLIACETVQGAGRDMTNAGRTITAESQEVQDEL
jgi:predicted small secreted protein